MRTLIPIDKIDRTKFEEVRACGEYVALLFSDGTACVMEGRSDLDGEVAVSCVTEMGYVVEWGKVELGLCTETEIEAERKVREENDAIDRAARNRQDYERFKEMYEVEGE